jgi:hypothetical protein
MIDDLYMMLKLESSCMIPWDRSPPLVNSMWIRRIEPCIFPQVIRTWSLELCLLLLLLVVNLFLSQCCFCPGCSWAWKSFFLQRNKIYKSKTLSLSPSLLGNRILSWTFLHTQDYSILVLFLHIIKDSILELSFAIEYY